MDRLLAVTEGVGQPLRPEDWAMIQNVSVTSLAAIIKSLCTSEKVILWGCVKSINLGRVYLTEGAIYYNGELFQVAACNFAVVEEYIFSFKPVVSETEIRTFKDLTEHEVYQLRRYEGDYAAQIGTGGINYTEFSRMTDLQVALIMANISTQIALSNKYSVLYKVGFSAATSFGYLKIVANGFNVYMLIGAFHANTEYGNLCDLPTNYRPSGDFVGTFWTGGGSVGTVRIKKDGKVWINGASTTPNSVNYITLIYPRVFDDPVNYDTPTGAGSQ